MSREEIIKALETQVQRTADQLLPRFQGLINSIEDEFDLSAQPTPITVRMMTYEVVFTELLAKMVASASATFNHPIEQSVDGVMRNFKEVAIAHHKAVKEAFPGGHNVHADSEREELPPDSTNG